MPAPDSFASKVAQLDAPASRWFSITPHDTNLLPAKPRAVYVGTSGDLAIANEQGDTVTLKGVDVGYHAIRPDTVKATGTTATNLVGLY